MEEVFKSSKSEERGLALLDKNMKNILSIGISTGGVAELKMAKKCPEARVIATTIDENGLAFSRDKLQCYSEYSRIDLKLEDVAKPMPYEDNFFDFVYARLVLHYLTKQQLNSALEEIYRVLKPGGIFFVVARNNNEWELTKPEFVVSYDEDTNITTYYEQWKKGKIIKRQFLSEEQLRDVLTAHKFTLSSIESYREYLYTDYERLEKNKSAMPNYLTEVVVTK